MSHRLTMILCLRKVTWQPITQKRHTILSYENIVYLELRRRNKNIYYWKSSKGKEVDFVIKEGLKISEAIQVCFSLSDKKTRARELQGLMDAKEELNPRRLIILTEDEEDSVSINNTDVKIIPLWKWLISLHDPKYKI